MKRTQALLLAVSIPLLAFSADAQAFGVLSAPTPHSPYSITQETEHTQTLADGTHIDTKTQRHLYRDSYGRTRIEIAAPSAMHVDGPDTIDLNDPVSGKGYILEVRQKTAFVLNDIKPNFNGSPVQPGLPPPSAPPQNTRPEISHEDLGTQTVEGLLAKGTRTTVTIPIGQQGNDRPIVTVHETWTSPDLPVPVYSKNSDPRNGDTITRIVSIDRSEPDPALFQVPPDYVLRDPTQQ